MKTTLEFSADEAQDALDAMRAWEWKAVIREVEAEFRKHYKYGEDSDLESKARWASDILNRHIRDQGLELE